MRRLLAALLLALALATPASKDARAQAGSSTTCLNLFLPTPGAAANQNVWGALLNTDLSQIDQASAGILSLSVAGSSNVTLTSSSSAVDQARNQHFIFTGALTGNITIFWPQSLCRVFSVSNQTTGAFTITLCANNGSAACAGRTMGVPQNSNAILVSDGTNVDQRAQAGIPWAVAGGTADAITGSYYLPVYQLYDGLIVGFRATAANATTTPSFNLNSLGPHTITKRGGAALAINDIPGNLAELLLRYNLANTRWELLNPTQNGYDFLGTFTASSSSLNITTSGVFTSAYDVYEIELVSLIPSGNNDTLLLRVSEDGGSSWKAASSAYSWAYFNINQGGTGTNTSGSTGLTSALGLTNGAATDGTNGIYGKITAYLLGSNSRNKYFQYDLTELFTTGGPNRTTGGGYYGADPNAVNAIQFFGLSSSNLTSGTAYVYGKRKN